ncbi:MAG: hypothetical protein IJ744_06930 [Lachnospiraceae bacterium]|nr:hypothetical protein [Lachnospiraceae bacterium]
MGTTLTTLHLYDVERSVLKPLLASTDQIQEQNAPWLTVVPTYGETDKTLTRFNKLARQLTQEEGKFALVFFYFDNDVFQCSLFQNGKKSASCESNKSWAKFGKKLNECFGDDKASKAFRYVSKCNSVDEQLTLLEETLGTALYALQEEEPRIIIKRDNLLQEIKEREARLRKRPNCYKLTEVQMEDWPKRFQYFERLYQMLRPQADKYDLVPAMYETKIEKYFVPGNDKIMVYPYQIDWGEFRDRILIMNGETLESRELGPISGKVLHTMWQTKKGELVLLICWNIPVKPEENDGARVRTLYRVVCLDENGKEQWQFNPDLGSHGSLEYIHSSEQGVITLFASGFDGRVKSCSMIFQINAETGELLRIRRDSRDVHHMIHVDAMNAFLFCRRSAQELVLLNESLEEIQCIKEYKGRYYFEEDNLCGSVLWEEDYNYERYVDFYDLQSGKSHRVPLEVPSYVMDVLSDGRILGVNEKQNRLTVFDKEGSVIARCTVPGGIYRAFTEDETVYLVELRPSDDRGWIYDGLYEEMSMHLWRLDPTNI